MPGNYKVYGLKDFYTEIKDKGLRVQHQFAIQFGGSVPQNVQDLAPIYVESASLPGRRIVNQPSNYFGFPFQIPVNTQYTQEWSCQVKCDAEAKIRAAFENWMDNYADLRKNTGGSKGRVPTNTYALVHLLKPEFFNNNKGSSDPQIARTYRLEGIFPVNLDNITQSHTSNNLVVFGMTFAFQYWYIDGDDPLE